MKNLTPHATIAIAIVFTRLFSAAVFFSISGKYFFKTNHKSDISSQGLFSIEFTSDLVVGRELSKKQHMDLRKLMLY